MEFPSSGLDHSPDPHRVNQLERFGFHKYPKCRE